MALLCSSCRETCPRLRRSRRRQPLRHSPKSPRLCLPLPPLPRLPAQRRSTRSLRSWCRAARCATIPARRPPSCGPSGQPCSRRPLPSRERSSGWRRPLACRREPVRTVRCACSACPALAHLAPGKRSRVPQRRGPPPLLRPSYDGHRRDECARTTRVVAPRGTPCDLPLPGHPQERHHRRFGLPE